MTKRPRGIGNRLAPARFIAWAVLLAAGIPALLPFMGWRPAVMLAFDAASLVFIVSCIPLFDDEAGEMRDASRTNDANRAALLGITIAVGAVILVSVGSELVDGKYDHRILALIIGTLVTSWTFSNLIYALHYAHVFYLDEDGHDHGGLAFPKTDEPTYWDFIYFALCIGMTFQTSDVDIERPRMRKLVTIHALGAFVFNLGVVAFTINVLGGAGK